MKRVWLVCLLIAGLGVWMVLFQAIGLSQGTTGTISGGVKDASGAVIPAATITVRDVDTGVVRKLTTDSGGHYSAPQLALDHYEVTAEASGFETTIRGGIELTVGREAVVDFALQVGAVAQEVTVTGEAPLVESTNATVGALVSQKTLQDIPLNGRSFTDLTSLEPGVVSQIGVSTGVFQGGGRLVMNGARPQQSLYVLDGVEISDLHSNTPPTSVMGQTLGVDTIQEFSLLQTNYGSQFGRAVGGIVNAVTRSGTNSFHGDAFEFLRNSSLDAKNFFNAPSGPIPPFRRNQFGGTVGGPIKKDKMFFFGSYEGVRQSLGTTDVSNVFSNAARGGQITGCPPPLTSCSASQVIVQKTITVNPTIAPLLQMIPANANGPYLNDGIQQLLGSRTQAGSENYGMARIDYHPTNNDTIFGRYVRDGSSTLLPDVQIYPDGSGRHTETDSYGAYNFIAVGWTRILSPTTLNAAHFGFTRNNDSQCECIQGTSISDGNGAALPAISSAFEIIPGLPWGGPYGIPNVALAGGHNGPNAGTTVGADLDDPILFVDNSFIYADDVQVTRGRHSLDIGGDFRRYQEDSLQSVWGHGNITWLAPDECFLSAGTAAGCTGFPGISSITTTGVTAPPNSYRGWRQSYGSLYVQDDFRMKSNLTFNLGLRWEKVSGPSEVNGRAATFENIISDSNWTELGSKPLFPSPSDFSKGFAPRVGFAYSLDEKTSVRGGFGMFLEMPLEYGWGLAVYYPPYSDRLNIVSPTQWPNPLAGVNPQSPAVLAQRQPLVVNPNLKLPYVLQYNMGVERQVGQNWVIKITYVGNRGIDQEALLNNLQPVQETGVNGLPFTPLHAPAVNPNLNSDRYYTNLADTWYDALQLRLERRFSNGMQFAASYSWANDIGNDTLGFESAQTASTGTFEVGDSWDYKHADKGPLQQDVRQNFTFNYNYELPVGKGKEFLANTSKLVDTVLGGWQINGIVTARTGLPIDITGGGYNSTNYCNTCSIRPNLIPGGNNNPAIGNPSQYFNVNQFATVAPGYYGNVGINTLVGPKLVDVDFSLFKDFAVAETRKLQFRAEFFNLLNHPNFANPSGAVFQTNGTVSPTAGVITSTAGTTTARQMQLALKFMF